MPDVQALRPFLKRLLDRCELTREEQEAILSIAGTAAQARCNVDIVSPGDTAEHACLVVDGVVGRFGQFVDGRRQITAFHVAGDMCDLHSVVAPKVGWSLQALSTTTMLKVPHSELRGVAKRYPAIAEAFWRDCVVDASILSQWVVNVGRRDARMRLAHVLCEMAIRMEQARLGRRDQYEFQITQSQLADALGLTPVHVNRVLQSLRSDRLVETQGREIRILEWDRPAQVGDFDDAYLETRRPQREAASLARRLSSRIS